MTDAPRLDRLDAYFDAVQRDSADVEPVGPFTLFVSRAPYPLYARPRHGERPEIGPADLETLSARCADVGMPLAVEWIEQVTPSLRDMATAAGLAVRRYPLLALDADRFTPVAPPPGVELAEAADAGSLRTARAVAHVAFGHDGTAVGEAGVAARDEQAARTDVDHLRWFVDDAAAGRTVTVGAAVPGAGVVASGLVKPVGDTAEIMGVATLPAYRRRGLGAAVTSALVAAAIARGATLLLLSADGDDVARVYERLGFTRVGHTGQAERPD